jgi:hypothetical protein
MEPGQRYSLRWDRYQCHLVTAFESLLEHSDFVDVTLGSEGRKLSAHKMLLSACSPYFRELLKDNPCQHPIILLRDIPYKDLAALLQFMYNGEVSVQQDHLDSFLKSAESLKIQGLTDNSSDEKTSSSSTLNQIQVKPDESTQTMSKRKRRASSNETKTKDSKSKQARPVKPEVVDVLEDSHENHTDHEKGIPITAISHQPYDQSSEDYGKEDEGGGGDESRDEDVYVEGQAVYEGDEYTDEQQGWTDWNSQQPDVETGLRSEQNHFQCDICKKTFMSSASLRNHVPYHHGKTTCQFCGKVETTRSNLYRHLSVIHNVVR